MHNLQLFGLAILGFLSCVTSEGPTDERPIVGTKLGKVQGIRETSSNGQIYYAFRGIPYAKPPLGETRFKKPEVADSWGESVKDAKEVGSACRQFDFLLNLEFGTEDCLFVNVFTPEVNPAQKRAVMVWIHGGGFQFGSGGLPMYGPDRLIDHDIIIVTINYRLGVFGFLSTGDDVIPGNAGMWDQVLALKWVQQNIAAFGGDPAKVTIFGESAGGASVSMHILSPESKGLFSRAIIQSGTAYAPWAMQENPLPYAQKIASNINCATDSSAAIRDCLLTKTEDELFNAYNKMTAAPGFPSTFFSPVVEEPSNKERFLPDKPSKLIKSKRHNKVPVIIGVMQNEAGMFNIGLKREKTFLETNMPAILHALADIGDAHKDAVAKAVYKEYFSNVDFNDELQIDTAIQELFSDVMFNAATDRKARQLFKAGDPVFLYKMSYQGEHSLADIGGYSTGRSLGPTHADELRFLHDMQVFNGGKLNDEDTLMSKKLLTLWTNFAKAGNPTPSITEEIPIKWEPVRSKDNLSYLNIDKDLTMESNFRTDKARFWNKYLPKVASGKKVEKEEL